MHCALSSKLWCVRQSFGGWMAVALCSTLPHLIWTRAQDNQTLNIYIELINTKGGNTQAGDRWLKCSGQGWTGN